MCLSPQGGPVPATHTIGSDLPSPLSRVSLRKWPFKCRLQMLPWEVACDTLSPAALTLSALLCASSHPLLPLPLALGCQPILGMSECGATRGRVLWCWLLAPLIPGSPTVATPVPERGTHSCCTASSRASRRTVAGWMHTPCGDSLLLQPLCLGDSPYIRPHDAVSWAPVCLG